MSRARNVTNPVHGSAVASRDGEADVRSKPPREEELVSWFTLKSFVHCLSGLAMVVLVVRAVSPTQQPIYTQSPSGERTDPIFLPLVHSNPQATSAPTRSSESPEISFACLDQPGPSQTVTGFYTATKFEPAVAAHQKYDARGASFEYPATFSHAMVILGEKGGVGAHHMCWAGGFFTASPTWHGLHISWDQSKHGDDGDGGVMNNTTAATAYEENMTWTGLHIYNVHDAIRTNNTYNHWTVQHVWFDYIRDDCIENDANYSGTVYDSLFDGCYTGISNQSGDGAGQTITLDQVLLRMEPMPYPYKWDTKNDPVVTVPGYTIPDTDQPIPFGHGSVFKGEETSLPEFAITNSVFLHEYNAEKTIFPPKTKVKRCQNNTIIWLSAAAEAPTYLLTDFPGCFTIITDATQGKTLWKELVTDWHHRHPGVGAQRKPVSPGDYKWPRY